MEAHPLRTDVGDALAALVIGSRRPLGPSAAGTARVAVTVLEVLQQRQGRASAQELAAIRDRLRRSDRSLRAGEQPLSVTSLLAARAGAALVRELLGPLLEPTREAAEQRRILSVWLAEGGSWEAAARELGLHRNTVRRQIEAAQQALGAQLTDMAVRTDLWVALRFADEAVAARAGE